MCMLQWRAGVGGVGGGDEADRRKTTKKTLSFTILSLASILKLQPF